MDTICREGTDLGNAEGTTLGHGKGLGLVDRDGPLLHQLAQSSGTAEKDRRSDRRYVKTGVARVVGGFDRTGGTLNPRNATDTGCRWRIIAYVR
jgi:hypothetical protein